MSLSSLFSRLISPLSKRQPSKNLSDKSTPHSKSPWYSWRNIIRFFIAVALILSAVWLLMAVFYQFGANSFITWLVALVVSGLLMAWLALQYLPKLVGQWVKPSASITGSNNSKAHQNKLNKSRISKGLIGSYALVWLLGLGWFFSIEAKQERHWQDEVAQVLSYTRDANNPDLITFSNVRNFDWQSIDGEVVAVDERWDTRTVDMSKLSGVDIINSYWMGPLIAHTLVSFRFEGDRPLSFSLEIRKEDDEKFSALAGFFRRFELSLIASEERDIIYTRSNARGEQVYLLPISHLQQSEVKSLFESYLIAADDLNNKPSWYNTFTSNCTNIIFYMARIVSDERLPWDYRIWVSGWLPNYLYDIGMLDANPQPTDETQSKQPWSMDTWYERSHINPKVIGFDNQANLDHSHNSAEFSNAIRQGIPIPPLADTQDEAEANAMSQAQAVDD